MKKYDALFIFPSHLKNEALDDALAGVRKDVEKLGGEVLREERLGVRNFARRIKKKDSGSYVRLALALGADKIAPLQARLKLNETVFRAQIVLHDERAAAETEARRARQDQSAEETNHG